MREAIENLVLCLADEKNAVEVDDYKDGSTTVIEVRVAESDMGRLIGRQGRTVRAVRSLLYFAGQKDGRRYNLQIVED